MAAPSFIARSASKGRYVVRHKVLLGVEPVWRYILNAGPTREYRRAADLSPEGERVLRDLNRDGCARSTLLALTGDPTLLGRLQETARELEAERADEVAAKARALAETDDLGDGNTKPYLVQYLDADRPVIHPQGVLAVMALDANIKAVADAYYGMRTRVADVNVWRNLPSTNRPVASQLWHRDQPDDHLILKMFVYLEDVVEGAGPLSYIKGTHGKGDRKWKPRATLHDGHNMRAHDAGMELEVAQGRRPRFTGEAGTVILADTIGWHKGGQATTTPRLLIQVLYASHGATAHRQVAPPAGLKPADAPRDLAYDWGRRA